MRRSKKYFNSGVEVWAGHSAWFWRLTNPCHNRGIIGVTASEADAVSEARGAIQEACGTPPIEKEQECRQACREQHYFYEY